MLETKQVEGGILPDELANSKGLLVERRREQEKYANGLASQESNVQKAGDSSVVTKKTREQEETDLFLPIKSILDSRPQEKPAEEQRPIRFKDAIGRKFTFPFDLVKRWPVCEV